MRIIDNKKDYYDYLSGIYGIDEKVVFDRRGSMSSNEYHYWAGVMPVYLDSGLTKYVTDEDWLKSPSESSMYLLEVGFTHYLFRTDGTPDLAPQKGSDRLRRIYKNSIELIDRKTSDAHYDSESVISIAEYNDSYWQRRLSKGYITIKEYMTRTLSIEINHDLLEKSFNTHMIMRNPILRDSLIPKIIPPKEIWQNLYDYLSAMNEPKVKDNRTDIQKLEGHGMNKRTSFRHPIK